MSAAPQQVTESMLRNAEVAARQGKLRHHMLHVVKALCEKLRLQPRGHKANICRIIYIHYGLDISKTDVAPRPVTPSSSSSSSAQITADDIVESFENNKTSREVLLTEIILKKSVCARSATKIAEEIEKFHRGERIDVDYFELHAAEVGGMAKRLRELQQVETALEEYTKLAKHAPAPEHSCKICYSEYDDVENMEMVFPGCGHVFCSECVKQMKHCPFCRVVDAKPIRIFRN
jgi:hypothetical protein